MYSFGGVGAGAVAHAGGDDRQPDDIGEDVVGGAAGRAPTHQEVVCGSWNPSGERRRYVL
jgi:hypothetical protein